MVTTTIRFPDGLYQQLSDYAEENDLSKNHVIKMAVRELLERKGIKVGKESERSSESPKQN